MKFVTPLEIREDGQSHFEYRSCDWLYGGREQQGGEPPNKGFHNTSHSHMTYHVTCKNSGQVKRILKPYCHRRTLPTYMYSP